jgi:hypothetical protein
MDDLELFAVGDGVHEGLKEGGIGEGIDAAAAEGDGGF